MPKYAKRAPEEFSLSTRSEKESDCSAALEPTQAVQKILSKEDSVFEKRVQAIAFASELEWLIQDEFPEEKCPRLTTARYYRTPRGVFSPEIREALNKINHVYSRVAYSKGHRTRKYNTSQVADPATESTDSEGETKAYEIINEVYKSAEELSDGVLMDWCLTIDDISGLDTGDQIDLKHVSSFL
ncbi:hypothetical protein [Haloferax larsenii]|uniref:Uncharacterized protein n=1 Tax=Haloferax larsenii TaxID=302484 RepID=A0A1H7KKH2_HALLR|nr:hypothetical protein [Haloferax larsenii]SEK87010.1 hypothetical protein SAMN04488691_10227 [Haloferax larsenii]